MFEKYAIGRVYVDSNGNFIVQIESENDHTPVGADWFHVGDVSPDEPRTITEFCKWLVEDCPDSEFPEELTDGEIEEIRQDTREGRWYDNETRGVGS